MANSSYLEKIIESRLENGARIIDPYLYPQVNVKRAAQTESFTKRRRIADVPPPLSSETMELICRLYQKYEERLSREMAVVFKLNEHRATISTSYTISPVGEFTKGEAAKLTGVSSGELLDMDNLYGGIIGRAGYLFISETRVLDGTRKYGNNVTVTALIDDLIKERQAARALGAPVPG